LCGVLFVDLAANNEPYGEWIGLDPRELQYSHHAQTGPGCLNHHGNQLVADTTERKHLGCRFFDPQSASSASSSRETIIPKCRKSTKSCGRRTADDAKSLETVGTLRHVTAMPYDDLQ